MLDLNQVNKLSKKLKTNNSVVIREYIQILFLKELYDEKFSQNIFFKGGTCIRLVFGGARFSEDLDFTVSGSKENFNEFLTHFFKKLTKLYGFNFKKRKTVTGEKYLLTVETDIVNYIIFINLDFSFREEVIKPALSIITTDYPVIFTSFINHLSGEEILAEKIGAIITRDKGRDVYDLWFLLSLNIPIDRKMVEKKLQYYGIANFNSDELVAKVNSLGKNKFILELKPFVPINEREKLGDLFDYTASFLKIRLSGETI